MRFRCVTLRALCNPATFLFLFLFLKFFLFQITNSSETLRFPRFSEQRNVSGTDCRGDTSRAALLGMRDGVELTSGGSMKRIVATRSIYRRRRNTAAADTAGASCLRPLILGLVWIALTFTVDVTSLVWRCAICRRPGKNTAVFNTINLFFKLQSTFCQFPTITVSECCLIKFLQYSFT